MFCWITRIGFAVLAMGMSAVVSAGPITSIQIAGDGSLGDFEGSLTYQFDNVAGFGHLWVQLKNTSPIDNGGYLVGFVFNSADNSIAKLHPNPQQGNPSNPLSLFYDVQGPEEASPYGAFEFGAALAKDNASTSSPAASQGQSTTKGQKKGGSNPPPPPPVLPPDGVFLGSGNPTRGLPVMAEAIFHFRVTGANASTISVNNFFTQPGVNGSPENVSPFLVRFRGFDDGGSNKTPGVVIPLPASAWAGLLLLGGVVGRQVIRHYRRR